MSTNSVFILIQSLDQKGYIWVKCPISSEKNDYFPDAQHKGAFIYGT